MARPKGSLTLNGNIECNAGAPLDARAVVQTLADLTAPETFGDYAYVGMRVSVAATGQVFVLSGEDTTDAANWRELGAASPGGGSVILKAGRGIKIESAVVGGVTEYTISLDLTLESETPDLLTITEKKENNP